MLVPVILLAAASAPHMLKIGPTAISTAAHGRIVDGNSVLYTIHVNPSDRLIVNAYGTQPGFGVIAVVKFPDGSRDGNKANPSVNTLITKAGFCEISVDPNMMMNNVKTGTFKLEVVRFHDWTRTTPIER